MIEISAPHLTPDGVLRARLTCGVLPLIGVYDMLSATLAARHFEAVFCSGYGFAASHYGLPDEGFIAWPDMVAYVERMRAVLPETHIVVDIDDGYGDPNLAANVARRLERVGASGVILEDQRRPKRCGHLPGKEILPIEDYLARLDAVLAARAELFVVARTDAASLEEGLERAARFAAAGADGVMVEGLTDLDAVPHIRAAIGPAPALTVNLIAGGKTPPVSLAELSDLGADLVVYSTPCLFAAHESIERTLRQLKVADGRLDPDLGGVGLAVSNGLLRDNLVAAKRMPLRTAS